MNEYKDFDKVYVLDTNIILEDANQVLTLSQEGRNLIVLPETVIDELDKKKSGLTEISFQAREFGRILSDAEILKTFKNDSTQIEVLAQTARINIVSLDYYNTDGLDSAIVNDRKIIQVAKYMKDMFYGINKDIPVILLSNDIMCRTRAISFDIKAEGIRSCGSNDNPEFIKHIVGIKSSLFNTMENKPIQDFDPDYKPENFCYHFHADDGNEKLAYIVNERINFIDENELRKCDVKPLNAGQLFAAAGMADDRIDVCVIEALAGSGKTLLAVATGIKLVRQGKYDKIIYIRNSVESVDKAEEVGFLPGLESKFEIYNYPLYDTLHYIVQKSKTKAKPDETDEDLVERFAKKYNIETMWNGAIRGRTINNAFVILDEVQNFAKPSLRTVLSRLDKDSKVVCIGSNRQIDHPYINKYTNGLSSLLKATKEPSQEVQMFGTELNKVVRGPITQWTERIFD